MNERKNRTSRWATVVVLLLITSRDYTRADFTFGEPTNLGPTVNSSRSDGIPSITANGLSLFFNSQRPGSNGYDLWVTTRPGTEDNWGIPTNLGSSVNSSRSDACPSISADGLTLFFASTRSGGHGNYDLWITTRVTTEDDWDTPGNLGPNVNSSYLDSGPCTSADGLSLFFMSNRPGGSGGDDVWVTTRETIHHDWGIPVNLGQTVNSSATGFPSISPDGLLLFMASMRAGGYGAVDLWVARRTTINDSWNTPVNLGPVINSVHDELAACIPAEGNSLFFSSRRSGGIGDQDIWQAPIIPVVDFTGDYKVDIEDLIILIEHWGQNEPSLDMGPMPWGDGTIDAADLEVLMRYWGQELDDPYFIAHWELDEDEGMFATDSVGENNGIVFGNPLWCPEEGQINGALEFDGTDDMIIAKFVLNPKDGPFSVFAWVKGGAPGQTILSQQTGVNWLQADVDGTLMTELTKSGGRTTGSPLYSETVITDGNWHRIGFVWDGSERILYVDDIPVALDSKGSLDSATGGLVIGVGTGNQAGTFWSGMIDDVCVYD